MHSSWAEQTWAVFRKDLLLEMRSRVNFNAMLFFAGTVLLIFSFALGPDQSRLFDASGGILWLAFVFAGILAFGRSYQLEAENNAFEGLLLIAQNRSAIYLGKMLGTVTVMLLIGVLGTAGFASIGALYGALAMSLRAREVLLPLLMLPITVPVLLGAVKATTYVITGNLADIRIWLELLAAFDVIFVTAGLLIYEYAVET